MESKNLLLVSLLVLSIGFSSILYQNRTQLLNEIEYHEMNEVQTQKTIQQLSENITLIKDEMISTEQEYESTLYGYRNKIEELNINISRLNLKITVRDEMYDLLDGKYKELEEENRIYYLIHIATNLDSFYDLVREEKGLTGINVIVGGLDQAQPTQISFASKLALHDLGFSCFPRMEEDYYEATGNSSYIMARETLKQIIGGLDISETDTDTQKIAQILEFVNDEVYYKPEPTDFYMAPTETLRIGSGDCDDYSILAAALFEMVGINSALGLFDNAEGEWHMMVLVNIEGLEGYHYSHWHDLTNMGLDKGYWTIIEPQRRINNQVDGLDIWNIHYAKQIG